MAQFDKIYIYFDTNSLEDYLPRTATSKGSTKSYMSLSEFKFPQYYYDIEKFIADNELRDKVEILIPEIVWMELKKHLIEQYNQDTANLKEYFNEYKKIFSDLIDISYEFKENDYSKHISELMNAFLENPRLSAKILSCPKDEDCVSKIIQNAMYTKPPFSKAHKDKKEYSDAGFKDALIAETIFANRRDDVLSIFVSKDSDFKDVFEEISNIVLCDCENSDNRRKRIIEIISEHFLIQKEIIKKEISENEYMFQELIAQSGLDTSLDYKFNEFIEIREQMDNEAEEEKDKFLNIWDVIFTMYVGETLYKFSIEYDGNAHGLISGDVIND